MDINPSHAPNKADRSYDYTKKYPTDPEFKELNSNARFWKVYLDESETYDAEMVNSLRSSLDGTLIFAALFSAVVSSFLIQTTQKLEPDYGLINASLLAENNLLLRVEDCVSRNKTVPPSSLGPDSSTHSFADVYMNVVFFMSLLLALSTAFVALLAKGWLQAFTRVMLGGAREQCLIRQLRIRGLEAWLVPQIIHLLPLVLQLSWFIFFWGLCFFVRDFHWMIRVLIYSFHGLTILIYSAMVVLSILFIDCPYRQMVHLLPLETLYEVFRPLSQMVRLLSGKTVEEFSSYADEEQHYARSIQYLLNALCIRWLSLESTNTSVQAISLSTTNAFLRKYHSRDCESSGHCEGHCETHHRHYQDGRRWNESRLEDILPLVPICITFGSVPQFLIHWSSLLREITSEAWHIALYSSTLLDAFIHDGVPLDDTYSHNDLEAYPLQHACTLGLWKAAATLIHHVPPSHLAPFGPTRILMLACMAKDISGDAKYSIVEHLLTKGASVEDVDSENRNVLHHACQSGCPPKILTELLLSGRFLPVHPRFINYEADGNQTPLLLASEHGSPSVIHALLLAKAEADTPDQYGRIPLHFACARIESFCDDASDLGVFEELVKATGGVNMAFGAENDLTIPEDIGWKTKETPLDKLVSHRRRLGRDSENFKRAYKLMREKGAQCGLDKEGQAEIDLELELGEGRTAAGMVRQ